MRGTCFHDLFQVRCTFACCMPCEMFLRPLCSVFRFVTTSAACVSGSGISCPDRDVSLALEVSVCASECVCQCVVGSVSPCAAVYKNFCASLLQVRRPHLMPPPRCHGPGAHGSGRRGAGSRRLGGVGSHISMSRTIQISIVAVQILMPNRS